MAITDPTSSSYVLNSIGGVFKSGNQEVPEGVVWPTANVLPEIFPMRKMTPMGDDVTPAESYHRNSLEGVPWAYPYLVMLGSSPRYWVLRQGAPGMVMQNGTFDENGKWTLGNGGILKWDNPVAGTYTIVVDVFDQVGQVTFRHEHVCGDASKHIIVSVSGAGTGDGSSASNAMSWANAYLGDTTLSPTQGKVLHLIGGDYTASIYQIFPEYHSRNIVHYALDNPANGTPKFQCRFNDHGSFRFIAGIEFHDIELGDGGILHTNDNVGNLVSWGNRFIRIKHLDDGSTDNEACHVTYGIVGVFRQHYTVYQNYYEDVEVAATDLFSVETFLCSNEVGVVTDPAYTTRSVNPFWYAKAGVKYAEFSNLTYNNPTVNGGSSGIIHVQHGGTYGDFGRSIVENNFISLSGGAAIRVNTSANNLPIDAIGWIRRNSIVGGYMQALDWDNNAGQSRYAYFDSNAAQNSDFSRGGLTSNSVSYTIENAECSAATGVIDSAGNLTITYAEYLYTRGTMQGIQL